MAASLTLLLPIKQGAWLIGKGKTPNKEAVNSN